MAKSHSRGPSPVRQPKPNRARVKARWTTAEDSARGLGDIEIFEPAVAAWLGYRFEQEAEGYRLGYTRRSGRPASHEIAADFGRCSCGCGGGAEPCKHRLALIQLIGPAEQGGARC